MSEEGVNYYKSCLERMKGERMNYDSWCQDVADYTLPKRDFTVTRAPNQRRTQFIYDNTAVFATTMLASGLHGMLTPPAGKWFKIIIKDAEVDYDSRLWLDRVEDVLFTNFSSPRSLFASQSYELYLDLVAFGQAVMMPVFAEDRIVYRTKPLNMCWVQENSLGEIDTLYYTEEMSPAEIIRYAKVMKWDVHKDVKEAYEKNLKVKFEILHVVEPRDAHYGKGAVATKKPFKSVYIDTKSCHIMSESGFDSFPYLVPRFSKRSGETYGYGPGMDALPEVRVANQYQEVMFRAAAKNADPPVLSPIEGVVMPMRLDPNGINYYDPSVGKPEFWSNGFNPNYLQSLLMDKQNLIQKMYYIDWMNMPDRNGMTATEVIQRAQESMRMLGPMLSRVDAEFMSPLIFRTIELMLANNMLPPVPDGLQGAEMVIEYTSPIAQAQRVTGANNVLQGLSIFLQLAQVDPSVMANVNANELARDQVVNSFNWPAKYLNSEEAVAASQQQQAAQAQDAQSAEVAETYSKAIKNTAGVMQGAR